MILAVSRMSRAATAAAGACLRAEQRVEKIAVCCIALTRAAEFKARVPIGRRPEILSRAIVLAQLIIGCAFFRALEHLVRLADFLEARLGIFFLADVRMIFPCKFAIGLLDLSVGRIARNAHYFVIILEFHLSPKHWQQ